MSNYNEPSNKLNTTTYQEKLDKKWSNKFTITGEYISSNINSTFRCNECGCKFTMRPVALMSRGNCPNCTKLHRVKRENTWNKMSNEDFIDRIKELVGEEYTSLSEYIDAANYITMRHNVCGHTWKVKARSFMCNSTGSRCPLCAKKLSNKEIDLLNYVKSIYSRRSA